MDKERVISDIKTDLEFVVPLLKKWPKCYWIWNHRIWLLQQATQLLSTPVARKLWSNELALCSMMLTRDSRNFHGWGYRFMVVSQLESEELEGKSMVEQEFAYTTRMVHTSLSNFSAWHHRSKLIPRLLSERNASAEERKQMLDEELELMHQALWTDPEDQSLWFYHHFLISTILSTDPEVTFTPDLGIEEREEVVRGQNEGLKEMIDGEEPKWIYSALWEYTVGMARMLGREPSGEEKEEMRSWLGHLRRLDPTREGRWRDWEVKLRL